MFLFVYTQSPDIEKLVIELLKDSFKIIRQKDTAISTFKTIKENGSGNYALFNFCKKEVQFEFITNMSKKIMFTYLSNPEKKICPKFPSYIQSLIKRKQIFHISKNYKDQLLKFISTKMFVDLPRRYFWNNEIRVITNDQRLFFLDKFRDYKPVLGTKKRNVDSDFFRFNKGKLCILFIHEDQLMLYELVNKFVYRIQNSTKEGTKHYCLNRMISASEADVIVSVDTFEDVITMTIVGFKSKIKEFGFKDFHDYFTDAILRVGRKSVDKMKVIENNVFFMQEYDSIHIYIPKLFSVIGSRKEQSHNSQINYQILFDELIFL